MENLRTLYLYDEAGLMQQRRVPGQPGRAGRPVRLGQGPAGLDPAGYWLWNLRGQISANLPPELRAQPPIFDMYLNDLPAIEAWTKAQMNGKPGACVPEYMRFNGNGYYNGGITADASCATASNPSFNA